MVLSNHDVVRHATRYGLDDGVSLRKWPVTGRVKDFDEERGNRPTRAASLITLSLPGSTYTSTSIIRADCITDANTVLESGPWGIECGLVHLGIADDFRRNRLKTLNSWFREANGVRSRI